MTHFPKISTPTVQQILNLEWSGWITREEIFERIGSSSGSARAALLFIREHELLLCKALTGEEKRRLTGKTRGRPKFLYKKVYDDDLYRKS